VTLEGCRFSLQASKTMHGGKVTVFDDIPRLQYVVTVETPGHRDVYPSKPQDTLTFPIDYAHVNELFPDLKDPVTVEAIVDAVYGYGLPLHFRSINYIMLTTGCSRQEALKRVQEEGAT